MNWIETEKQKPEKGQQVLIYDNDYGLLVAQWYRGNWLENRTGRGCCSGTIESKYWMPLPEFPDFVKE